MSLMERVQPAARRASTAARGFSEALVDRYVDPRRENRVVYAALARQILRFKGYSFEQRAQMHTYATSLLLGDGSIKPADIDDGLVCAIDQAVFALRFRHRSLHPIMSRVLR